VTCQTQRRRSRSRQSGVSRKVRFTEDSALGPVAAAQQANLVPGTVTVRAGAGQDTVDLLALLPENVRIRAGDTVGDQVVFTHQEIWQDREAREQFSTVAEWRLQAEPWIFVLMGRGSSGQNLTD
jgi:hypothetical protein